MEALRCKQCGDTRWSLMGFAARKNATCEICGGDMVAERRVPSHAAPHLVAERRESRPVGATPPSPKVGGGNRG